MNKYEVTYLSTDKMRCIVWADSEEDVKNLKWEDSDEHEYILDVNREVLDTHLISTDA